MNGVGSVIGPLLTGFVMSWLQLGLFVVSGSSMLLLLAVASANRWLPEPEQIIEGEELADVIALDDYLEDESEADLIAAEHNVTAIRPLKSDAEANELVG